MHPGEAKPTADNLLTVCAISIVAAIVANLDEGVGHELTGLLTGVKSRVLATVA